jgi:hypothetical protein
MEALENIQVKRSINFKEIIDDSNSTDKLFNLKQILIPLNQFNLQTNEPMKQKIKDQIITALKTIKTDFDISNDHLYILYSICSFEALLILCQMQLDNNIDVNEYKKFIDYLQKLKANPINDLFYVLIKLDIKEYFPNFAELFNNNPFTIYILLYELLNSFIDNSTKNDYKDLIFNILNDLIKNTTDSKGELRTDLQNFTYSTLFDNLRGESNTNTYAPAPATTPEAPAANEPAAEVTPVSALNTLISPPTAQPAAQEEVGLDTANDICDALETPATPSPAATVLAASQQAPFGP